LNLQAILQEAIRVLVLLESDNQVARLYLSFVIDWYDKYNHTTEQQIDTLLVLYYTTGDDRIYSYLFKLHEKLLIKLAKDSYHKYESYLDEDDYEDVYLLVQGEFMRRIQFYKFPSIAPFPKYVKLYIKQWINSYTKLIVRRNVKTINFTQYGFYRESDKDL
jgi:hypothetical protein